MLISAVSGNGTLTLNGTAVVLPVAVTTADISLGLLEFIPDADAQGTGYAAIEFNVRDDGGIANGGQDTSHVANKITIDVNSVNDAPSGTDNTVIVPQNNTHVLSGGDFGFSDVSDGDCLLYTSPSPRDATLSRMPSSA